MKKFMISMMLVIGGCSDIGNFYHQPHHRSGTPAFTSMGADIYFENGAERLNTGRIRSRVDHILFTSNVYWDNGSLAGYSIVFTDDKKSWCGFSKAGGCTYPPNKVIVASTADLECIEDSILGHEIGHVAHTWDIFHHNSKFRTLRILWTAIRKDNFRENYPCGFYFEQEFKDAGNPYWNSDFKLEF